MNIYYELEKFTVSGTISCADSNVDMTSVKIAVDGVETNAVVAANGEYTLNISAGTYDLKFYCDGYVAFAANTQVSGDTDVSVALVSDLYEIGNYKNTKSTVTSDTLSYNAYDTDGSLTVTGNKYGVLFPNTATTENFVYIAQFTAPNSDNANANAGKTDYGVAISNGNQIMTITFRLWGGIIVNVSDTTVYNGQQRGFYAQKSDGNVLPVNGVVTVEIVRNANTISVIRRGAQQDYPLLTISANGIQTTAYTSVNANVATDTLANAYLEGFFGVGKELAVGVASLGSVTNATPYVCNFSTSPYMVSSYGTVMTAKDKDSSTSSRYTQADAEDGNNTLTVSGTRYTILLPNTATTENFTFTASASFTSVGATWRAPGVAVCNGEYILSFSFLKTGAIVVYLADKGGHLIGTAYTDYSAGYKKDNTEWGAGTEFKIVRTATSIEVYARNELTLRVTSSGIECGTGYYQHTSFLPDKLDKSKLEGFFGDNVSLACGISAVTGNDGWIQNAVYTLSYVKGN